MSEYKAPRGMEITVTRFDNPMARAIIDPPICHDCGVDIPWDHEPDLPYCAECLVLRDEPELELGTRVRITEHINPFKGMYGVIDSIRPQASGNILYRVASPTERIHLGWFHAQHLTPDSGGKPPVDPETARIGVDLLLAPRRSRLEQEKGR